MPRPELNERFKAHIARARRIRVVQRPLRQGRQSWCSVAVGPVPAHAKALVTTIKDVERTTIEAAREDSPELAVRALALHPLVPSVTAARKIFDGYRSRLPDLAERFA
jgi:6-phospho-beta-glucosidase